MKNIITSTAIALGAAAIVAGSPVIASAAPLQASPVRLDSVQIAQSYGIHNNFAYPGLVSVAFTNESSIPVKQIVFAVEADGQVIDRINDVGNYLPGVTVKHNFPDLLTNTNQTLAVESVDFADGTTWTNTDQVAPRRQAAQAPSETAADLFPLLPYETE